MTVGRRAALAWTLPAACLLLSACGTAGAGAAPPRPAASHSSAPIAPSPLVSSLSWKPGASFRASVDQQLTAQTAGTAPVTVQLAVTVQQTLRVTSVQDRVADLEVSTRSWSWQHPGGSDPVGSLPAPFRLRVGPDGVILSGSYWSMPVDAPLPGLDFFSTGLPPGGSPTQGPWSASWRRTLADGTVLVCQAQGGLDRGDRGSIVQTSVHCPVRQRSFAADGSPDLVQGDVRALVRSAFDPGPGRVLATSYASSFAVRETTPQGATTASGSVTTMISFAY